MVEPEARSNLRSRNTSWNKVIHMLTMNTKTGLLHENALLLHSAMEILELVSGASHTALNKVTYFKLK